MTGLPVIQGVTGLREIGRGGFGVVYLGTEIEFDRQVAVKVLMPSLDERARRRFERERRAMGSVSGHANIVTVYRGGLTDAGHPYLVMEYVRGGSLTDRLQTSGPIGWRQAATMGAKLADALAVAHRAGILHRDVKPGNVFLTATQEPKLGDFGIARLDDGQDSRTGSITASIAHAPPEIVDGQRGDERSDLYSLASTIYAMTTGFAPHSRDPDQGLSALLGRIANDTPSGLHLESAAAEFETLLLRALSKRPADRQETMVQFAAELRRSTDASAAPLTVQAPVAGQPDVSAPVAAPQPVAGGSSTSTRQLGFIAILALAIAGFGGWAVARAVLNANDEPQVVETASATATAIEPTSVPAPTAVPPTPLPAAPEQPTSLPTAVAESEPTPAGGVRGSGLGSTVDGFTRVRDFSGAITVDVPEQWAFTVQDGSTVPLVDDGLGGVSVLAAGGTLAELSANFVDRDLTRSGIYVFAARLGPGAEQSGILEVALSFWTECTQGERSQILLTDGNADFQILQCPLPDGTSAGVVILALIPNDDPDVAVSVFLQFADLADLESLATILGSLDIDASRVAAADEPDA